MKRRSIHDILLVVLVVVVGLCFLIGVIWILIERIKEFTTMTSKPSNDIVWTLTLVGSILVAVFKKSYEVKKEREEASNSLDLYLERYKRNKRRQRSKPIKSTIHRARPRTMHILSKVKGRFYRQRHVPTKTQEEKQWSQLHFKANYQK